MTPPGSALLDWAMAARPKQGFDVTGDGCRVRALDTGTLVVVLDGIGHGNDAKAAADAVCAVVDRVTAPPALPTLVEQCHEAAKRTRGVVMSAAWFPHGRPELHWMGVGNVEGVVRQKDARRERLLCVGGIVGERLPKLQSRTLRLEAGDTLLFATDGAPGALLDEEAFRAHSAAASVDDIAATLLARHAVNSDDALVLVARYGGSGAR